jgi:hypothetical protein
MDQTSRDDLITDALSRYLGMPIHTLFQVPIPPPPLQSMFDASWTTAPFTPSSRSMDRSGIGPLHMA